MGKCGCPLFNRNHMSVLSKEDAKAGLASEPLRQRQRELLAELAEVHKALGLEVSPAEDPGGARFANVPPGRAIRRLLADERAMLERSRIVWELIAGDALTGAKHAEETILRAIDVNVELGLLVERDGKIGLPEWKFYERPWRRTVKDPRVRLVMEQMHVDLGAGTSIAELAREANVSPSRLTHLFQRELSITPKEYMRRIRMRVVRHMLSTTRLKQKEILAIVGITDRSHFSREFKTFFRHTPTNLRKIESKGRRKRRKDSSGPPEELCASSIAETAELSVDRQRNIAV